MTFALNGTPDELTVVRVGKGTSEAVIVRAINNDTRCDHCLTDDGKLHDCPTIRPGLSASTLVGKFWF
jgi:hypothetical protein